MKLKLLIGLSGNEYSLSPGDERDFEDDEAERLGAMLSRRCASTQTS